LPRIRRNARLFQVLYLHLKSNGLVVQLVRMPACHAGGREFESRPDRKNKALAIKKARALFFVIIMRSVPLYYSFVLQVLMPKGQ
jgi:hypothetical protein